MTADEVAHDLDVTVPADDGAADDSADSSVEDDWGDGLEPPRWKIVTSFVLSLLGLGVASYLTYLHFTGKQPAACPTGGHTITCNAVLTSPQSTFLHIPVALLGLFFYVGMAVLNLPVLWRSTDRRVHMVRLGAISVGMAFALYLVSAELLIVGHICEYCTSVHIFTFFLFVLIVTTVPGMLGWGRAVGGTPEGGDLQE